MAHEGPTGEMAWFRAELWRSLTRPRAFARSLAREHYGIGGVLVVVIVGAALSLGIDSAVLASKGRDPLAFVARLVLDALLLGIRLAVTCAVIAAGAYLVLRALGRWTAVSLDQLFTAITFAIVPLLLTPLLAVVLAVAPESHAVVGVAGLLLVAYAVYALALYLLAILPLPLAAVAFVLVIAGGAITLGDQVTRVQFTALAYEPQLAPALAATPVAGTRHAGDGWSITLPPEWKNQTKGVPGEAARFETDRDQLIVARASGGAFVTADQLAESVDRPQRQGMDGLRTERRIVRSGELILIDDISRGTYQGRPLALRVFTTVTKVQGLALVFRFVEPPDEQRALDQAAAIAATWDVR